MKKHIILISVGFLNLLHGVFHLIQFIQSLLLVAYSTQHEHTHNESIIDKIMHSPIMAIIWAIIGLATMIIGIRDYRHHRKCHHNTK